MAKKNKKKTKKDKKKGKATVTDNEVLKAAKKKGKKKGKKNKKKKKKKRKAQKGKQKKKGEKGKKKTKVKGQESSNNVNNIEINSVPQNVEQEIKNVQLEETGTHVEDSVDSDKSTDYRVYEGLKKLRSLTHEEAVQAFIVGEERVSILNAVPGVLRKIRKLEE